MYTQSFAVLMSKVCTGGIKRAARAQYFRLFARTSRGVSPVDLFLYGLWLLRARNFVYYLLARIVGWIVLSKYIGH